MSATGDASRRSTSAARRRTTSWSAATCSTGCPACSASSRARRARARHRPRPTSPTGCAAALPAYDVHLLPVPDGEDGQDGRRGRRLLGVARAGGLHPLRRRGHPRRRRDHRPRRLRGRDLAARRPRGARADQPAGDGRRRRRRQDRHQHRRRQEPRRLVPRARRRAVRPRLLDTLPRAELVAGLGEVVKCGFIADPAILDLVETTDPARAHPGLRRAARARRARHPGQDRRGGRPTSRRPAARGHPGARSSTTATPWRTRSSGPATTGPPRRGRRDRLRLRRRAGPARRHPRRRDRRPAPLGVRAASGCRRAGTARRTTSCAPPWPWTRRRGAARCGSSS